MLAGRPRRRGSASVSTRPLRWLPAVSRSRLPGVVVASMLPPRGTVGVQTHVVHALTMLQQAWGSGRVVHPGSGLPVLGPALLLPGRALRRQGLETGVRLDRYWHRLFLQVDLLREFARRPPALVYAQDPRSAYAALWARRSSRTPVVMAVHYNESQARELVERGLIGSGGRTEQAIHRFEASVLPQLDGLVFVSEYMRRRVLADVPAAAAVPSVIVPNFLGPVKAADGSPSSPRQLRDLVSVGNLTDRKNHRYLLQVLAEARRRGRRYTLTLVGDGPQRDALQRLARKLGVHEDVVFAGVRFDVDDVLRGHRIYVHSSLMENCPFAVLEAFRAGLPVMAGAVGGIPEVLGDDGVVGRYWDLDDPAAGAAVLSALLDDPTSLATTARRGRDRYEAHYSSDVVGRRLVDFLRSVVAPG
jgi:glycosyltransferase involved in cell wall biosynthesis